MAIKRKNLEITLVKLMLAKGMFKSVDLRDTERSGYLSATIVTNQYDIKRYGVYYDSDEVYDGVGDMFRCHGQADSIEEIIDILESEGVLNRSRFLTRDYKVSL